MSDPKQPVSVVGIGTYLPPVVRENDFWPDTFGKREHHGSGAGADRTFNDIPASSDALAASIMARDLAREANDPFLASKRRHFADETVSAASSETAAAKAALSDAGIDASEVDLVLSYSIVPDRVTPPCAGVIADNLGASRALAFGVDAVCATAITQIEIARAYIESGQARVVLVTQSHLMLRTVPTMHPASPGLGDAASALVLARGPGLAVRATYGITHGAYARAVTWIRGRDDQSDVPWWKAGGDFNAGSRANDQAKLLMQETVSFGAETVRAALARAAVDVERVAVLASVQPRGFMPGAIAERLGLPRERAVTTYDDIAHVGACGPVFNLARARQLGMLSPGGLVALYGQGAGFTRAAAVLEVR